MINVNLDLNSYKYSYANFIGFSLKRPLFKLVSNLATASSALLDSEERAWLIARVALHCLAAAIFVLPAGLAWLIGKSISYFSKTQIDYSGLSLAPQPILVPKEEGLDLEIDTAELLSRFDKLNSPEEDSSSGKTLKRELLKRLCLWINAKNSDIYQDDYNKRILFCEQVSLYLRSIIKKMKSGEISEDQVNIILNELAEASTRCYPTWLEVSGKLYEEVCGQPQSARALLLRWVQEYKESIVLEFAQQEADTQWHALNYIRNILGEEWGLNTTRNDYDLYAGNDDPIFGKSLVKWLFLQRYEDVNCLIASITEQINCRKYSSFYSELLTEIVEKENVPDLEVTEYVLDKF